MTTKKEVRRFFKDIIRKERENYHLYIKYGIIPEGLKKTGTKAEIEKWKNDMNKRYKEEKKRKNHILLLDFSILSLMIVINIILYSL